MTDTVTVDTTGTPAPEQNQAQVTTPEQSTPAPKTYKVHVDGNEVEVSEDELLKGYSHNSAASKRMQEAAMVRKEAEEVLRFFKSNPREAFQRLGMDAREFAQALVNEDLEEALMDPKDKELRDYKKKVDAFEAQRRQAQEQFEKEQMEAEINRHSTQIQNDIISTLETAGLPKTDRTVGRIIYYMQSALQAGYNVSPKDVIEHVKQDYIHDFKSMLGGLSEDQIELFLGQDVVRRVAKSSVKEARRETVVPREVNANRQKPAGEKTIMSPRDFFKR